MLNAVARGPIGAIVGPFARFLARVGVSPDVVTVTGMVGTVAAAVGLLARGVFFWGAVVVTVFVLVDMLDGAIARARGTTSVWGALLDSTLDRVSDAAIFAAVVWWFTGEGDDALLAGLALYCLVAGTVVSYVKARAEGLGLRCDVGFAERAERLIIVLVGVGLSGLGLPYVLAVALWVLAAASTVTVGQRMVWVHRQIAVAAQRPAAD